MLQTHICYSQFIKIGTKKHAQYLPKVEVQDQLKVNKNWKKCWSINFPQQQSCVKGDRPLLLIIEWKVGTQTGSVGGGGIIEGGQGQEKLQEGNSKR